MGGLVVKGKVLEVHTTQEDWLEKGFLQAE